MDMWDTVAHFNESWDHPALDQTQWQWDGQTTPGPLWDDLPALANSLNRLIMQIPVPVFAVMADRVTYIQTESDIVMTWIGVAAWPPHRLMAHQNAEALAEAALRHERFLWEWTWHFNESGRLAESYIELDTDDSLKGRTPLIHWTIEPGQAIEVSTIWKDAVEDVNVSCGARAISVSDTFVGLFQRMYDSREEWLDSARQRTLQAKLVNAASRGWIWRAPIFGVVALEFSVFGSVFVASRQGGAGFVALALATGMAGGYGWLVRNARRRVLTKNRNIRQA
jgi:hypothetical protein